MFLDSADVRIHRNFVPGFDAIRVVGLRNYNPEEWIGSPSLPAIQERLVLPAGKRVASLAVTNSDPVLVGTDVWPMPIVPQIQDTSTGWTLDPDYYENRNIFPPTPEDLASNDGYRGIRLADVVALPLAWDPVGGNLILYRSVQVLATLEPVPAGDAAPSRLRPERRYSRDGMELRWVRENVRNPEDFDRFYARADSGTIVVDPLAVYEENHATGFHPTDRPSLEGPSVDMVIISSELWANGETSHGDVATQFQPLADWRTKTGVPTVVRTLGWIRENYPGSDDPDRIRYFLRDAYSLWSTDYVLLGGDVEVVPARVVGYYGAGSEEYPVAWYYSGLDASWGNIRNPGYGGIGDAYPELWVGRVPVRDAAEASDYIEKLEAYERVPDPQRPVPPNSHYTTALLAAGFTNFGGWYQEDDLPTPPIESPWWENGIWQAERLKTNTFDVIGFESFRLYPKLTGTVSCRPGVSVDCYKAQRAALASPNAPEDDFTTANVFAALESELPSVVFHVEHSSRYGLGGLSSDAAFTAPARDPCFLAGCDEAECTTWKGACHQQYLTDNPNEEAFTREMLTALDNGPAYFIGLTYGSHAGMYDADSVVEHLVRDPNGGAVGFAAKVVSNNSYYDPDAEDMSGAFLREALVNDATLGAALANAFSLSNNGLMRTTWHLFGDPSIRAWTAAPTGLWLGSSVETLGNPDFYEIEITARELDENGALVPGTRICLRRADDIYAIAWTDASGIARFPSLLVASSLEGIDVWGIAENRLPGYKFIEPATFTELEDEPSLVYQGHWVSDVSRPGLQADLFEAGDRLDLDVVMKNISSEVLGAGRAKLIPTPRVRMSLEIDGSQALSEDIFIGKAGAHPPAQQDTFSVIVNESGIRPERSPMYVSPSPHYEVWRSVVDYRYRVRMVYGATPPTNPSVGVILVDGGVVLDASGLDAEDTATVLPDGSGITFEMVPDATPDEIIFEAFAPEWVEMIDDSFDYDDVDPNATTSCEFVVDLNPELPPRTRLTFTVATRVSESVNVRKFSDFYLETAAPSIAFTLQRVDENASFIPECSCAFDKLRYFLKPVLINRGNADADSVEFELEWSGADVEMCPGGTKFTMAVPAGEESTPAGGFDFCDWPTSQSLRVEKLTIRRTVNGLTFVVAVEDPTTAWNPWPVPEHLITDLVVKPTGNGFRASWKGNPTGPIPKGYHCYVDSAAVIRRVTRERISEVAQTWTISQPHRDINGFPIDYRVGVSRVTSDWVETQIHWSSVRLGALQPRSGWPKRMSKGPVKSVLAVDMDSDGDLEVVAGGRVLASWNGDGTPLLSGNADGLLFDPFDDADVIDERYLYFWGEIAAADIDDDGKTEVVGSFGDGNLYVVDETGTIESGFPKVIDARSTPTLADLDLAGDTEIVLNGYLSNNLYAFNANGTSFRSSNTNGLYANLGLSNQYNTCGVAIGDVRPNLSGLEIAQPVAQGKVVLWRSQSNGFGNPSIVWEKGACGDSPPCGGPPSNPVIGDINDDDVADVTFNSHNTYRKTTALNGIDGSRVLSWRGRTPADQGESNTWHWVHLSEEPIQWPALAELNNTSNGVLEVLTGRQFFAPEATPSGNQAMTKSSILHWRLPTAPSGGDVYGWISTPADTIPRPGRKQETQGITRGNPIVADIDSDGSFETIHASNHAALFAWELEPAPGDSFEVRRKLGWPLNFSDFPCNPAIAHLVAGADSAQLIVGTDDGFVYLFDLMGVLAEDLLWPMAGLDAARTNNLVNYSGGSFQRDLPDPATLAFGELEVRPNPVTGGTVVRFRIPSKQEVQLALYDVGGRLVREFYDGPSEAGIHEVVWAASASDEGELGQGVYFLRLSTGGQVDAQRVIVAGR